MALKLKARTKTTIQGAGGAEANAISQILSMGGGDLANAPTMQMILQALQGPTAQDRRLAYQASFGGLAQGLKPQLDEALRMAREQVANRGIPISTISAAQQALAVPRVMNPALAQAQQTYAGSLLQLPFQRAGMMGQVRGQAFATQQANLSRMLQERGMNTTTDTYKQGTSLWKKLLGTAIGAVGAAFGGPIGAAAGNAIGGALFGGNDGGTPETGFSTAYQPYGGYGSAAGAAGAAASSGWDAFKQGAWR